MIIDSKGIWLGTFNFEKRCMLIGLCQQLLSNFFIIVWYLYTLWRKTPLTLHDFIISGHQLPWFSHLHFSAFELCHHLWMLWCYYSSWSCWQGIIAFVLLAICVALNFGTCGNILCYCNVEFGYKFIFLFLIQYWCCNCWKHFSGILSWNSGNRFVLMSLH